MKKIYLCVVLIMSALFVSCSKGSDEVAPDFSPKTIEIGTSINVSGLSNLVSENEFVAKTSGNKVTAIHVGKTIVSDGDKSIQITVTGKYNILNELKYDWGTSMSTIFASVNGTLYNKGTISGNPYYDYKIIYSNCGDKSELTGYMFKNNILKYVSVICPIVYASEIVGFLKERYNMGVPKSGESAIGYNSNDINKATTYVSMKLNSSGDVVCDFFDAKYISY